MNAPERRLNLSAEAWAGLQQRYADQLGDLSWGARASYSIAGRYLSWLGRMQDRRTRAASPPRRPVFILGHWRSGTTLLHELLAGDPQFACPTTYACMNPQHFVLSERGAAVRTQARPMDGMAVSTDSPQEDEFALLCLGAPSPYEAMLFPRAFDRALATTSWGTLDAAARARWESCVLRFLSNVGARDPQRRLLLKSPPHSFRVEPLRRLFPDASFLHIVRNPLEVVPSTCLMWRELQALYALTPPPHPEVLPQVADVLERLDGELAAPPAGVPWHRLRFEDLVADPHAELARLYAALDLGDYAVARPAVDTYLARTAGHKRNRHELDQPTRALIAERCAGALRRNGYS